MPFQWPHRSTAKRFICSLAFLASLIPLPLGAQDKSCYEMWIRLREQKLLGESALVPAKGTDTPIARAFEKEGSWYPEIQKWWDNLDQKYMKRALKIRARDEAAGKKEKALLPILKDYLDTADRQSITAPAAVRSQITKAAWSKMSPQEQIDFLFAAGDVRKRLTKTALGRLFYEEILNFDRLKPSDKKPEGVKITNDLGSYEIVSRGEADRKKYQEMRAEVEDFLGGPVGHQHLVHAWPKSKEERAKIAPRYIELLDSGTWFLFWRQLERNPDEVESIMAHEFLGVYPKRSLKRLHDRMVEGDAEHAKDKYRMIGFRSMAGRKEMPGQVQGEFYPDFELRSGNKGVKRDFMEDMLEARLASGDYSGLQDFNSYQFDPAAPVENIAKHLSQPQVEVLKAFEEAIPKQRSDNRYYRQDLRNKIFSPLLPWEQRLPFNLGGESFNRAQKEYGEALSEIAKDFLNRKARTKKPESHAALWEETKSKIEKALFEFADKTQLSKAFENYLVPRPGTLPDVRIASGPVDVNNIDLGIEFSFRFLGKPQNKADASERISQTASEIAKSLGAKEIKEVEDPEAHGHGLGVKYSLVDEKGQKWRVEWDGVQRYYRDGKPYAPQGGHVEIPSPKAAPQTTDEIRAIYETNRALGQSPSRAAGGAHINIDLQPFFGFPEKEGPRKFVDFLNQFESNREMIQFLWQHPYRTAAAFPLAVNPSLQEKLNQFNGSWDELARLLYQERYFNPYVTRKPGYTQLNLTALMSGLVPDEYQQTIDIKNPKTTWFPAFGGKGTDRMELRLFDAPPDEYLAALQIKYVRALLNKSLNSPGPIPIEKKYSSEDFENWKNDSTQFSQAAKAHLMDLGLDPKEFLPLIVDSFRVQQTELPKPLPLVEYPNFLPLKDQTWSPNSSEK